MDLSSPGAWAVWLLAAIATYLGSYAAEKGKRRAATEDSDRIRDELGRTTRALKEIEARISLGIWQEQKRWDERKDAYARLLVWLDKAYSGILEIAPKTDERAIPGVIQRILTPLGEEFRRAKSIAEIFLPPDDMDPLISLFPALLEARSRDEAAETCQSAQRQFSNNARTFFSGPAKPNALQ
jgi:hypothetical protein